MFGPRKPSSSYPLPGLAGASGGCVVDTDAQSGFGFSRRRIRWQLAALAAILLITMAVLGFVVEVAAALLAALLVAVVVDVLTARLADKRTRRGARGGRL